MLNEAERTYLRGLSESPHWKSILEKLRRHHPPPRYKPGKAEQYDRWVYVSGGHDAIEGMLSILRGDSIDLDYGENDDR